MKKEETLTGKQPKKKSALDVISGKKVKAPKYPVKVPTGTTVPRG